MSKEELQNSEPLEYTSIGVTAKCTKCSWQFTGRLTVEINTGSTAKDCPIIENCRIHHSERKFHQHFYLYQKDENVGFVAVSSAASSGQYIGQYISHIEK
ncbi:hypothetical protein JXA63_04000 [Candidatus Woesebacteria bacterium]|nr:hypothetical protein [Candidatus Woesebacteria bacterium]